MGMLKILRTTALPGMIIYHLMVSAPVLLMAFRTIDLIFSSQEGMKSPIRLQLSCYLIMAIQTTLHDPALIVAGVAAEFPRDPIMGGGKPSGGWIELDQIPASDDKDSQRNQQRNNNCGRSPVEDRIP